jgi:serine protease Do
MRPLRTHLLTAAGGLAIGLTLAVGFGFERQAHADRLWTETTATTAAMTPDDPLARAGFATLAKNLSPSVVFIAVERKGAVSPRGRHGRPGRSEGLGTGFIINADGWVVTNSHVVDGATQLRVRLNNRKEYEGRVVGSDPQTDIALVKFEPKEQLTVAPLGNSDAAEIGDWALAIGNPFGLSHTVTAGIISAKGRVGVAPDGKTDLYEDFIQTDASINPGNSGGPLFNMKGEVIGVNTAINSQGQGIGFAVPINMVKTVLPQLQSGGHVQRSMLGIKIEDVQADVAAQIGLAVPRGALVNEVIAGSPAEKGGVAPGDVIVAFDGKLVESSKALRWMASNAGAGHAAAVEVWRDGKTKTLSVTLAALGDGVSPGRSGVPTGSGMALESLGLGAAEITPELVKQFGLRVRQGVVITDILAGSPANMVQLQPGDVVLKIGTTHIRDLATLRAVMGRIGAGQVVTMLLQRGDHQLFRAFTP